MQRPTRRDVLNLSAATAAGLLLPSGRAFAARTERRKRDRRPKADFAVAFLTDMHVDGELGAPEGFAKAVRNAFDRPHPPEVLVTGGDLVMDILAATSLEQADSLYALFEKQMAGVKAPIHHTMGNHDLLGVFENSGLQPDHPQYGKKYFVEHFKQDHAYHSFDHEGWHFVILDSLGIEGRNYIGWVDEEQLAWLDDDLAATSKPTVVFTHVPLWSNFVEMQRGIAEPIPHGVSIVNAHQVAPILQRNNVKLVLAGHLHICETFIYKGVEYSTVGAVSGNWWKGAREGFEEGYARLEFRGDQVSWEYVDYGWEAQAAPATATAA